MNKQTRDIVALDAAMIDRSEQFDLQAPGGRMRISVARPFPSDPNLSLMDQRERPVPLYVLDSNLMFGLAVSITRMMQFGGHVPPCLVIGIGYPEQDLDSFSKRRALDLTPSSWRSPYSTEDIQTGGGPDMLSFIRNDLQCELEKKYEFDSSDGVLFGLSFGGLFSLYAYTALVDAFPHHIALSPSLHWDNGAWVRAVEESLKSTPSRRGRLYVAAGAREMEISPPTEPDMARDIQMVQHVATIGNLLADRRHEAAGKIEILPDESHHTILASGLARGLRYTIGDAR